MINLAYKYSELTEKIIGYAMRVHTALGNGFQEVIYQRCMEIEFQRNKLKYLRECEIPIYYLDEQVGTRRADFIVEDGVLVELKAITEINDTHFAQMINYLEAYKLEVGLLINFGEKSLRFKRFIKSAKSAKSV
jgi:GxxExxY protein